MAAWTPHVTVATVVEKDGRYLFVEEHSEGFVHTVFNQPAGHVECGETLTEAAIRETLEETGHHIDIDALLGIYTYTPAYVSGPYLLSLLLFSACDPRRKRPKT